MTYKLSFCSESAEFSSNLLHQSPFFLRNRGLNLPIFYRYQELQAPGMQMIGGKVYECSLPITFTPFASVSPCSARCVFCSETLQPNDSKQLSASLRPTTGYFDGLRTALTELKGLPIDLSLSGLEATDNADWLLGVLDCMTEHCSLGGNINERVLYSNAAGLADQTTGSILRPALEQFALTRAEISRHHDTETGNQGIMRFRPGQVIREQAIFEHTVRQCLSHFPIRLVCVVQKNGIHTGNDVVRYLQWAENMGITDVVFRELSRLGSRYKKNKTLQIVEQNRVAIEVLLEQVHEYPDLEPLQYTSGYYFWNLQYRWKKRVLVTFETSDYTLMKSRHYSHRIYKLIYHANGNLCGDWDPNKTILLKTQEQRTPTTNVQHANVE
jgi:hypothetical protein